ncbi:Rad17 cell cycle checkpoint protein-domain-containing protein [Crassisporium funariophilum]|nr:Rad17 cell cycle checkpoint protein-domain-containing protein [Crassisporium funariophilum]
MAPSDKSKSSQASQKKPKPTTTRARTVKLDAERPPSSTALQLKRIDPLTAFSRHLTPTTTPPDSAHAVGSKESSQSQKGKGKAKEKVGATPTLSSADAVDACLWVDKYEPETEAQLAVHVKKVEDVRRWLAEAFDGGPSRKLLKYRRILALTGPAGTGKTSTIRVLAREMGFEILEWRNAMGETSSKAFDSYSSQPSSSTGLQPDFDADYEGLFSKFEAFMTRASTCHNIFETASEAKTLQSDRRRQIILLEELPNVLHPKTQTQFHEALHALVISRPSNPPVPVVIIISDAGLRGEATDERMADGHGWGKDKTQVVDVRTVLSKDLLGGPYVTEIGFNPIAPTLLRKAVQALLNTRFTSTSSKSGIAPSKEVVDIIVESANGDIRSAIMALQFSCRVDIPGGRKKGSQRGRKMIMEAVTRREQSLALFHLIGKVLYNKRKGDPPSASATAKDLLRERDIDALLKDPTKLPPHLAHHERRTSRVDVDMLYADSPIDTSLFSLYIHQNYTQYCNELEESEGVAEWLSWIDSSGGEAWYQANPHQFHLLTLGTLHSLPSPVPRRSQKNFKPEFFAFHQKEKDAWDGVRSTRDWVIETELAKEGSGWRAGGWSKNEVVLDLGGVLKAKDLVHGHSVGRPPAGHKLFSRMDWVRGGKSVRAQQLVEGDVEEQRELEDDGQIFGHTLLTAEERGGWLEGDDIEDFD